MKKKTIIILVVSIVVVLLIIMGVIFIGIPAYLTHTAKKALTEIVTVDSDTSEESTETVSTQLKNQATEIFNQTFIAYETAEGETTTAPNVKALFSMIANSNASNPDRQIDVNGTVITSENLDSLKAIITTDMKYKIKCVLGDDGYVKTIELRYTTE